MLITDTDHDVKCSVVVDKYVSQSSNHDIKIIFNINNITGNLLSFKLCFKAIGHASPLQRMFYLVIVNKLSQASEEFL